MWGIAALCERPNMTTLLIGSALDLGYVKVVATINNSTSGTFMLSTKSTHTFFSCPSATTKSGTTASNDGLDVCRNECETSTLLPFVETFVGSSAKGKLFRPGQVWHTLTFNNGTTLQKPTKVITSFCVGNKWCASYSGQSSSLHILETYSSSDYSNTSNVTTLAPSFAPTAIVATKIGCVETSTGALKQSTELGVWGIAPGGFHPDALTLCFGTKKRPGRMVLGLEPDIPAAVLGKSGANTRWLNYTSDFILTESLYVGDNGGTSPPIQFLSPDTVWKVSDPQQQFEHLRENSTKKDLEEFSVFTRIDFSSTYSWVPSKWFTKLRQSLIQACNSLGCKGYPNYSDGASLMCFRFIAETEVNYLPDLEWKLANQIHILLPPSRYLFTTEDGSRCVGVFESPSPNLAVVGLNLLIGLRLRIDYLASILTIDSCVQSQLASVDTTKGGETPPKTTPSGNDNDIGKRGGDYMDTTTNPSQPDSGASPVMIALSLLLVVVFVTIAIGIGVQYFQKQQQTKNTVKRMFRGSSFLKNNFASRKQAHRNVTFKEVLEDSGSSSDDVEDQVQDIEILKLEDTKRNPHHHHQYYPNDAEKMINATKMLRSEQDEYTEADQSNRKRRESSDEHDNLLTHT